MKDEKLGTANEILNDYLEELKKPTNREINLRIIVLDILKYLSSKEKIENDLWSDIVTRSQPSDNNSIELPLLRKILEEHKILKQEKGM